MSDALIPTDASTPDALSAPGENTASIDATEDENASPSRLKRVLKWLGWSALALFFLLLFTLLKLPEDRIRNYVQGMISSQLAGMGITMTAGQSSLSIGFGVSYTMKDITLSFPPPQEPVKIEQISVSPALLPLLTGKAGAEIRIENKGGSLKADYSQSLTSSGPMSLSFKSSRLDLGSLGVLPVLANFKGSAILDGEGDVSGNTAIPTSLSGKVQLDLSKIVVDQQTLMGFSIPRLTVSEGKADINLNNGRAQIKSLRLGKPGNATDDIHANVTGDVTLGKNLAYSTLNLKADFSLSQTVLKSFILLDAILGAAKQPDGSYAYTITGSVSSPNPVPVKAGGK